MKKEIKDLVEFAIKSKNSINRKLEINVIDKKESELLKSKTGFNLLGYKRVIDKFGINHVIKNHGNKTEEANRGQIGIDIKDFELIPKIVKSENVIFAGKNKAGVDCLLYEAKIGNTFFYIEEIRTGKKELCMQTLYKRKPKTIK